MKDTAEMNAVARDAALLQYEQAYRAHLEYKLRAMAERHPIEAEGYDAFARRVSRAYQNELDDPKPEGIGRA